MRIQYMSDLQMGYVCYIHHHHHLPDEEDIFEEGELDKDEVVSKMEITTQHGAIWILWISFFTVVQM